MTEPKTEESDRRAPKLALTLFAVALAAVWIALITLDLPWRPRHKAWVVGFVVAVLASLVVHLLIHHLGLAKRVTLTLESLGLGFDGAAELITFVVVLSSALLAPVDDSGGVYRLRVSLTAPAAVSTEGAVLTSSAGGEIKRTAAGWEVAIPRDNRRPDGKVTLRATLRPAFLEGQTDLVLQEGDLAPQVTVDLKKVAEALVRGKVQDEAGSGVSGVRITVVGHEAEGVLTDGAGAFVVRGHAAEGQQALVHAEKQGYQPLDQWHPAGDFPLVFVLRRKP